MAMTHRKRLFGVVAGLLSSFLLPALLLSACGGLPLACGGSPGSTAITPAVGSISISVAPSTGHAGVMQSFGSGCFGRRWVAHVDASEKCPDPPDADFRMSKVF